MVQAKKIISSIALFLVIFGTNKGTHAHASMARTIAANSGSLLSKAKNSVISAVRHHPKIATVAALATIAKLAIISEIKENDKRYEEEIHAKIKKLEAELAQIPAEDKREAEEKSNLELKIEDELTLHRPNGETETMRTDEADPISMTTFADHIKEQADLGNYAIIARYVTRANNNVINIKHCEAHNFNRDFFKKNYPIDLNTHDYYKNYKDPNRSRLIPDGTIEYYIYDHYRPGHGLQYLCSYGRAGVDGRPIYTFYNNQQNSHWRLKQPQALLNVFYANYSNGLKFNAAKQIYHDDRTSYFYDRKAWWTKTQKPAYLKLNLEITKTLLNARKEYTLSTHLKEAQKNLRHISWQRIDLTNQDRQGTYTYILRFIFRQNARIQIGYELIRYLLSLSLLLNLQTYYPAYTVTFSPTVAGSSLPSATLVGSQQSNFANMARFAFAQTPTLRQLGGRFVSTSLLAAYVAHVGFLASWATARNRWPSELESRLWEGHEAESLNIDNLIASGEQAIQKQREALEQEAAKLRAQSVQ